MKDGVSEEKNARVIEYESKCFSTSQDGVKMNQEYEAAPKNFSCYHDTLPVS